MSKRNVTMYEGYTENKLHLLMLPLQHRGHDGVRVCRVCCLCGKGKTLFTGIQTVSVHHAVFIMFKKIENPTAYEMWSVIHF